MNTHIAYRIETGATIGDLIEFRKWCARMEAKYKRADIKAHYRDMMESIDSVVVADIVKGIH